MRDCQQRTNMRNLLISANCAECVEMLKNAMYAGEKDRINWIAEFICDYWEDWEE